MSFAFNRGVGSKKIGMQFSFDISVPMHFHKFCRPGGRCHIDSDSEAVAHG